MKTLPHSHKLIFHKFLDRDFVVLSVVRTAVLTRRCMLGVHAIFSCRSGLRLVNFRRPSKIIEYIRFPRVERVGPLNSSWLQTGANKIERTNTQRHFQITQ